MSCTHESTVQMLDPMWISASKIIEKKEITKNIFDQILKLQNQQHRHSNNVLNESQQQC